MIASLASVRSAAVAIPVLLAGLSAFPGASAADSSFKVDTRDNILKSASTLAKDLMALYDGNKEGESPGLMPGGSPPKGNYFWWQGGALMATYIDYYHLTGDDSYNDIVTEGMLHQAGAEGNFLSFNETASMTHDDHCIWGLSALLAAENNFPSPPKDKPQWIDQAKKVFDMQASLFQHEVTEDTCGGGLRWVFAPSSVGYNYKSSISNGCFLNLAARLARYTGNDTYADAAVETWDWMVKVKFIDDETYGVYDGAHVEENCTDVNKAQFSINSAYLLQGAAFMFAHTNGDSVWRERVTKLTNATLEFFFPDGVAYELPCEGNFCTTDMISFKGLLHRWLASATQVAPFIADTIRPVLKKSTEAAIKTCTGGKSGRECSFYDWADGEYTSPVAGYYKMGGVNNAGEQMNVLAAVESLLIDEAAGPATEKTAGQGGDNKDGASAPGEGKTDSDSKGSAAGRSEAQIVSAVMIGLGACAWLVGA